MADAGFEIAGNFYPFPQAFRLGDPVLVTELTNMEFLDFAQALDDETRREDPVVLLGLIGVAVWQANPTWKRERVARFLEQIPQDAIRAVGGEEGPQASPPAEAAGSESSGSPAA